MFSQALANLTVRSPPAHVKSFAVRFKKPIGSAVCAASNALAPSNLKPRSLASPDPPGRTHVPRRGGGLTSSGHRPTHPRVGRPWRCALSLRPRPPRSCVIFTSLLICDARFVYQKIGIDSSAVAWAKSGAGTSPARGTGCQRRILRQRWPGSCAGGTPMRSRAGAAMVGCPFPGCPAACRPSWIQCSTSTRRTM